jgi:RNA polymerase sigma factor (sigma-70 family)
MATGQLRQVMQTLRKATAPCDESRMTDGQLLETYLRTREEVAFAALVRRHGPMVWGVCRRVLRSHQDAEDAFQATFLVLVRKAASIVQKEKVANWLYGVAHRTALKARAMTAKRGAREKPMAAMPEPALEQQELWSDLQPLLDQELSRLPDKYRSVIVLCELEGKTRKEAARHFNLPEGTVATRLTTARTMLAKRLARQGVTITGGGLAAMFSQNASASVPASVVSNTINAATVFAVGQATATGLISVKAVALAEGVIKTMLLNKIKIATSVLITVAIIGSGVAAITQQMASAKPANLFNTTTRQTVAESSAVSGVVKAVSADKNTLTISQRDGDKTFIVPNDAGVVVNGRPGNLTEVQARAFAVLSLADTNTARSVEIVGPNASGILKTIDAEKRTITFDDKGLERTLSVTRGASVSIDDRPSKLTDLPPGAVVNLSWFADRTTARNVQANGRPFFGLTVKDVDPTKRTITFGEERAPAEVSGKTFAVLGDAFINIDGKNGNSLVGLPKGAIVHPILTADQKSIRVLTAEGRSFLGVVAKAVDAEKNTITFAEERVPAELAGKTFPVPKDANIQIDGRTGKLGGLPAGVIVNVTLTLDQKSARALQAEGRQWNDVLVKAVDADAGTVTFANEKAPGEVAGKTFPVAKHANVSVDGKRSKLVAIPPGAFVSLNLSVDQKTVTGLSAEGSRIGDRDDAVVQAVDPSKNTITVDIADEGEKTFTLAKDARIEVDGRPGKLAMVPKEALVNMILSVDNKTARSVQAHGIHTNGVLVKAVDAEKNTITFADDARPSSIAGKTFPVAKNAEIVVDGKPGSLPKVPAGCSIWLWVSVDQKTVLRIHAEGSQLGGGVVVQGVDTSKNTITVDIDGEGEKTFAVATDARIELNNKSTKLASLPKEAAVIIGLCADQKTVRIIQAKVQQ